MARLASHAYGKTDVRLTQVRRRNDRDEVIEINVGMLLEGNFDQAYTAGDNSRVLPTDTMKNTVYALARRSPIRSIETFALELAEHFHTEVPDLNAATVEVQETPWTAIGASTGAFIAPGGERRYASARAGRRDHTISGGLRSLTILKTRDSAFSGFLRNQWTTLPETRDRLLATNLNATWTYVNGAVDFNREHSRARDVMLDAFSIHKSESVQHTLYAMACAVLDASPNIADIHLAMPNKHRILVNLQPFGMDNPNEIFVPADEPSGYIEARVARS